MAPSPYAFFTNAQSRFEIVVLDIPLGYLHLSISVVPEAAHEASRGPLKGAVTVKNALTDCRSRIPETEMDL